jgi:hypothetical protein
VSTNFTTRVYFVIHEIFLVNGLHLKPKNPPEVEWISIGAEDRARTGHPDLGKVVLYQMSYFRV